MSYPKQEVIPPMPYENCSENSDLVQAMSMMMDISRLEQIVLSNRESINKVGWNGMLPLHHAVLKGRFDLLQLLVRYGAEVNCVNNFFETPLHYACRRGGLQMVHFLLQNGADVNAVDKAGRSLMHFAAIGGNSLMLHYLGSHTSLSYETRDAKGENALHICCQHGHYIAAMHLLKNDRIDPSSGDLKGTTPLHIVCEKGHGQLAWLILQTGKRGLLWIQNDAGQTPVDLAKSGKSNLYATLKGYTEKNITFPRRGANFKWYYLVILPSVWVAIMLTFLALFHKYLGGFFGLVLSFALVFFVAQQSHRINHISRRPNPIFMGAFVGGIFHCAFAQYLTIMPRMWPCPTVFVFTTLLSTIGVYLLWHLLFSDPGIDRESKICPTSLRQITILDIAEGRCPEGKYCVFSEKIHGDRTKFCRICENPMLEMDHHCIFLNTCVAKKNHLQFIVFILVVMLMQAVFSFSVLNLVARLDSLDVELGDPLTPYIFHLFKHDPSLFVLLLLCILSFMWETCLVAAQLSVVMRGKTTYFAQIDPHSSIKISYKQMLRNLLDFALRH